jgi:hypothetical protein
VCLARTPGQFVQPEGNVCGEGGKGRGVEPEGRVVEEVGAPCKFVLGDVHEERSKLLRKARDDSSRILSSSRTSSSKFSNACAQWSSSGRKTLLNSAADLPIRFSTK